MGGLFSSLSNRNVTDKQRAELQEFLEKTQAEVDAYNKAYEQNLQQRKEKISEIYESRKKIIEERLQELIYIDRRFTQMKDQRKCINIRASAYICLVLFNYYNQTVLQFDANTGYPETSVRDFMEAYDEVIFPPDEEMAKLVFGQLCQISPLLPLIWPIGARDSSLHEKYPLSSDGATLNSVEFMASVNGYIKSYIHNNLRRYTFNVCMSNCYDRMVTIDDDNDAQKKKFEKYDNACTSYIAEVRECLTNESFVDVTYKFLKQFNTAEDIMRLKMLSAKSCKGISSNVPKLLPPYYPKVCPEYELWESVIMTMNTLIYNYGSIRNNDGNPYITNSASISDRSKILFEGGKCFNIPEKYIQKCYETYFDLDPNHVWDYTGANLTDVKSKSFLVEPVTITGKETDQVWMLTDELVNEDLMLINKNNEGSGELKYINPTRKYTYQLLEDPNYPSEELYLPGLSADMTQLFKSEIVRNITKKLMINSAEMKSVSVYLSKFKDFMWSFDYLTTAPEGFDLLYGISPLCSYVYDQILVNGIKWTLNLPIDNTMTMSKINRAVKTFIAGDGKSGAEIDYPQTIWTESDTTLKQARNMVNAGSSDEVTILEDAEIVNVTIDDVPYKDADTAYAFSYKSDNTPMMYASDKQPGVEWWKNKIFV